MTPQEQQHEAALKAAFAAFATMARAFVQIYATHDPTAPAKLDAAMLDGAFIRIEIGVGGGGPIGAGLYAVRPDGQAMEMVYLDAPPNAEPFRFTQG